VGRNGRPFPVDTYIVAGEGVTKKEWAFLECSMSRFTTEEWARYRSVMENEGRKLPTRRFINVKLDQIDALLNHRFTDAEITEKFKRQNALTDMIFRVEERNKVKEKRALAIEAGDEDAIATCDDELAALVPTKLAFNTTLVKPANNHVNKEQERLAELNRRNQRLNAENVRKAQLAEIKAKRARKHLAPGIDELFEGGSDISRTGTPVNGAQTPQANGAPRGGTPVPSVPRTGTPVHLLKPLQKDKKGIPMIRKAVLDEDIIASMDLGIDIEL
jgi:RNA polymerase-associated protein RTF1